MSLLPASRRPSPFAAPVGVAQAPVPFLAQQAPWLNNPDDIAALTPAFLMALSEPLHVQALADRMIPVLFQDQSAAVFALPDYIAGDQADALIDRLRQSGYRLASPSRYALSPALLLAIARGEPGAARAGALPAGGIQATTQSRPSRTALADAFHDIVQWGAAHHASDIHLNVHLLRSESEVRFTVAGQYVAPDRFRGMPTSMLMEMLSVAWMDIRGGNGALFDPRSEQQGSLLHQVAGEQVLLRWSSLAADAGPSVCLRVLHRPAAAALPALAELGYLPDQLQAFDRIMRADSGALVFAGTVGSGKSTTLASLIASLPSTRKVITLEDPVEYAIAGAIQNTVTRHLDETAHDVFAAKLRALKRSGMTDVLLGEIRDIETGRAFMDLAGSGVTVYTTVHAPSVRHVAARLASDFIGVSPDFLATPGVLRLLVYQALLPKVCRQCALSPSQWLRSASCGGDGTAWLTRLESLYETSIDSLRFRNSQGCAACNGAGLPALFGYAGRTVAAELLEPGLGLHADRTAMDSAVRKAFEGLIDARDIETRFHAFETESLRRVRSVEGLPPASYRLQETA